MPRLKREKRKPTKVNGQRFVAMYPQQIEFFKAQERIVGFCTGIGAGKSRCGATRVLLSAKNGENYLCVSPSYIMLRKSTLPLMTTVAREIGVLQKAVMTPYPVLSFTTQDGGTAEAVFASGDQPEKLRGSNNDGVWLDEASLMQKSVFDIVIGRLRGVRGQMGNLLMTFTPKGRMNWTFGIFYEQMAPPDEYTDVAAQGLEQIGPSWYRRRPNTKLVRASSKDNPFISEEYYQSLKQLYSSQFSEQELEGNFVDLVGLMFKREWFAMKMRDAAPRNCRRVRYWDLAATEFDGCYTCGTLLAMAPNGEVFIEDVVRGQWSTMLRNIMIESTADQDMRRYNNEVHQIFEQEPGSGGKEQANQMVRMLAGKPVFKDVPSRGKAFRTAEGERLPGQAKVYRAQPFAAQCEAGNVFLVRGDWNDEWMAELTGFPEMKYCDQVDSVSAAYNYLAKSKVPDIGKIATVSGTSQVSERYGVPVIENRMKQRMDLPTFVGRN